jgi:hypothetical protein
LVADFLPPLETIRVPFGPLNASDQFLDVDKIFFGQSLAQSFWRWMDKGKLPCQNSAGLYIERKPQFDGKKSRFFLGFFPESG